MKSEKKTHYIQWGNDDHKLLMRKWQAKSITNNTNVLKESKTQT